MKTKHNSSLLPNIIGETMPPEALEPKQEVKTSQIMHTHKTKSTTATAHSGVAKQSSASTDTQRAAAPHGFRTPQAGSGSV
jgi:hypothetical protein